jgi:cytochrome c-type biogenesis protein CcmE
VSDASDPDAATPPAADAGAAPSRRLRGRYLGATVVLGLVVVVLIGLVVVLSDNVEYFRTVSEAVADRKEQGTDRFRLMGAVVPGSIERTDTRVRFSVTDGRQTVAVVYRGDTPDLFEDDAPVVCEGRWGTGAQFDSDRIMIRHGEDYEPPKVKTKDAPEADGA